MRESKEKSQTAYIETKCACGHALKEVLAPLSLAAKINYLKEQDLVRLGMQKAPWFIDDLASRPLEEQYVLLAFVATGGGDLFSASKPEKGEPYATLVRQLLGVEQFYAFMGGVIGYWTCVLELLCAKLGCVPAKEELRPPPYYDAQKEDERCRLVVEGIEAMPCMAEVYAVGGAADRLHSAHEADLGVLPAACLPFAGRTLLEDLIRDLEAREYLYFKLRGDRLTTPIVLMTSEDRANDQEIIALCKKKKWFARPEERFFFLVQPLVPAMTIDGAWASTAPFTLLLRPGGHGVLWKLARDKGAFRWLAAQGRTSAMVRQINNPLAGQDDGLLLLSGVGNHYGKAFGFVACERMEGKAEGANALRAISQPGDWRYGITNIEYAQQGGACASSAFPANTNILYANLKAVEEAVERVPLPGMLVNAKGAIEGKGGALPWARLESTMQNIADGLQDRFSSPRESIAASDLKTFLLLQERAKILSCAKNSYTGGAFQETPESAFYDLLEANRRLLQDHLRFHVPPADSPEAYLKGGPSCLFLYHPALGPLYSIIAQKISGGTMAPGSELQLEIAEVCIRNLTLDGSLCVEAKQVTGYKGVKGRRQFSESVGRLVLENVTVVNRGIDREATSCYWKNEITRKEALEITFMGRGEFVAKNVTIRGDRKQIVPEGMRVTLSQAGEKVLTRVERIVRKPTWQWRYVIDEGGKIELTQLANAAAKVRDLLTYTR